MAKLSDKIDLSKAVQKAGAEFTPDTTGSMAEYGGNLPTIITGEMIKKKPEKKKKDKPEPPVQNQEDNSLFNELIPKEEEPFVEKWPKTYEETCEYELRRAHEKGYPDPDFDFRKMYVKGQHKWFVRIQAALGEKEVIEVILNTIYPRMIVAVQPKAFCHCIGYNMQHQLFDNQRDAKAFYDTVQVSSRYKTERPMKRQEDDEYDEDDGDAAPTESLEELMNRGEEDE